MRQGIVLPESTFGAVTLTVSVQPVCAIACINICAHVKDAVRLFGHMKILHALLGLGSTALVAAVALPR